MAGGRVYSVLDPDRSAPHRQHTAASATNPLYHSRARARAFLTSKRLYMRAHIRVWTPLICPQNPKDNRREIYNYRRPLRRVPPLSLSKYKHIYTPTHSRFIKRFFIFYFPETLQTCSDLDGSRSTYYIMYVYTK